MILRRITQHVKDQNWFAVWLDFFIVVVGVFIGIQVANWNAERAERSLEAVYSERLHQEVIDLEAVRRERVPFRAQMSINLQNAITKLTSSDGGALTPAECYLLADNPPVSNPTDELPLVIELLSSGRLTIFTDKALETALGNFLITRSRARDSHTGIVNYLPNIDENYSELFAIRGALSSLVSDDEEEFDAYFLRVPVTCDEGAMRANQRFINDLANFELEYSFHVLDNTNVSEALTQLHAVLDDILGLKHEGTN